MPWQAYYQQFKPLIKHAVDESQFHSQALPKAPENAELVQAKQGRGAQLDEKASDKCMSEVMGTDANNRCGITPGCLNMMTRGGTSSYMLTHQLLFFSLGRNFGCDQKFDREVTKTLGKPLRAVITEKCGSIYEQMKAEQKRGGQTSDIFIEQLYTCGAYGFTDFFHSEWLQATRQQQTHSGCFKATAADQASRRLLADRDVELPGGCSIHKSSVASCLFSVFLQANAVFLLFPVRRCTPEPQLCPCRITPRKPHGLPTSRRRG